MGGNVGSDCGSCAGSEVRGWGRCVEMEGTWWKAHLRLGEAYMRLERFQDAVQVLSRSLLSFSLSFAHACSYFPSPPISLILLASSPSSSRLLLLRLLHFHPPSPDLSLSPDHAISHASCLPFPSCVYNGGVVRMPRLWADFRVLLL
jgi:hypothetical protein